MRSKSSSLFSALRSWVTRCYPNPSPDAELVRQFALDRSEAAFADLLDRHGPMVLGVARRVTGNEHAAEDVFQATFMVLARKADRLRTPGALPAWLHRTAHNIALNARRDAARRALAEQAAHIAASRSPLDELSRRELHAIVDEELLRLPELQRLPIILCCLEGRSQDEAARLLGWTPDSVKGRLERGRRRLKDRLARRGVITGINADAPLVLTPPSIAGLRTAAFEAVRQGSGTSAVVTALMQQALKPSVAVVWKALIFAAIIGAASAGVGWKLSLGSTTEGAKAPVIVRADFAQENVLPQDGAEKKEQPRATDLYGDPLPPSALARFGTVRYRPGSPLTASAVSADAHMLAGAYGTTIQIWNAENGKTLQRIHGIPSGIAALAFSPDNKLLAGFRTGPNGKSQLKLIMCDVTTGTIRTQFEMEPDRRGDTAQFEIKPNRQAINAIRRPFLTFLPGGATLLFTDGGPTVRLFDVTEGKETRAFPTKSSALDPSIVLSPDGQRFAAMDDDGTVRVWEITTGKSQIAIDKHKLAPRAVTPRAKGNLNLPFARAPFPLNVRMAFAPDAKTLATAERRIGKENRAGIYIWDVQTGKLLRAFDLKDAKPLGFFTSLNFSPNGKTLVSSSHPPGKIGNKNFAIVFWDVATGKEMRRLQFENNGDTASFLPDSKTLLISGRSSPATRPSGLNENAFAFVDAATGKPRHELDGHLNAIGSVAYSPDGRNVATAEVGVTAKVRVWQAATGRLVAEVGDQDHGNPNALAFSGKANILVVGYKKETVLWDAQTGKLLRAFTKEGQDPVAMAVATNGATLATCDQDQTVRIVDLVSGKEQRIFRIGDNEAKSGVRLYPSGITFSADLRLVACANSSQALIQVWDIDTGKELTRFKRGGRGASQLALSSDGRTLLETSGNKAYLLEIASGEPRRVIALPRLTRSVAYSPDNRHIAFGETERPPFLRAKEAALGNAIHIYDVAANRFVASLVGHEGQVAALSFSPDGQMLASGSSDMTGLLWNLGKITGQSATKALTANERSACWADLAGDPRQAYSSMWKLIGDKGAVSFLRENMDPTSAPIGAKEIQVMIANVGSDRLATRSKAADDLIKVGPAAEPELRKALAPGLPLETHRRIEAILRSINSRQLRRIRVIEVLEYINTQAARDLLGTLAKGQGSSRQTREVKASLNRLANRPVR